MEIGLMKKGKLLKEGSGIFSRLLSFDPPSFFAVFKINNYRGTFDFVIIPSFCELKEIVLN